jgi:hypothetical protein
MLSTGPNHDRRAVTRAAIKHELRSMFASVEISLSAALIADRRRAAEAEDHSGITDPAENDGL